MELGSIVSVSWFTNNTSEFGEKMHDKMRVAKIIENALALKWVELVLYDPYTRSCGHHVLEV